MRSASYKGSQQPSDERRIRSIQRLLDELGVGKFTALLLVALGRIYNEEGPAARRLAVAVRAAEERTET